VKIFRLIKNLILIGIVAGALVVFKPQVETAFNILERKYMPCMNPIGYSIGSFDERFGITQEEYLEIIKRAEAIWEGPSGQDLFEYKVDGRLKINLVYDSRQQATEVLQEIDEVLDADKATYDQLNQKYNTLKSQYERRNSALLTRIKEFEKRQAAYEKEVTEWNKKGGAPEAVYTKLETERMYLTNEVNNINQEQRELAYLASQINVTVQNLNKVAKALNINVSKYNEVGTMHGEEFNEGLYISGPMGESIDIYQFEDKTKLLRVLAHELGHAVGIEGHTSDPDSIMYRLNTSSNTVATSDDLEALKGACKLLK
jgi:uncharacterized coiled-coil protein SlyX